MEALDTQKDVELLAETCQNNVDNLIIDKEEYMKNTLSTSMLLTNERIKEKGCSFRNIIHYFG